MASLWRRLKRGDGLLSDRWRVVAIALILLIWGMMASSAQPYANCQGCIDGTAPWWWCYGTLCCLYYSCPY
jgi:hypothetical protein